jgi:hypothetical protein
MANSVKVRVCKDCSGFDRKEIEKIAGAKDLTVGCIDKCESDFPELKGKFYGFIDEDFVVCETKDEFFKKIIERK